MPGAGTSSSTQQQSQTSQTAPWQAAQPMLQSILGSLGGVSTGPTAGQTAASNTLQNEAGGVPDFSGAATGAVNNAFGASTTPQQGQLNAGYANLLGELSPYLQPGYLDPSSNPALSGAINTANTDITNSINGRFAAAGRDLSPGNSQALARGLAQGDASILAGQYNTNVGAQQNAASTLYNAAGTTATGTAGLSQMSLADQLQALTAAGQVPGLATAPGATQLAAATTAQGLPLGILSELEGLTTPIAGLGSQSSGTGTASGTQTASPLTQFGQLMSGLGGTSTAANGATSATGALGLLSLFSDERVKDDIAPVGELYDGSKVYSYTYKGDDVPRIGLLAQEVERTRPDAVTEIGGIKAVHYGKATERSRIIGMLDNLDMAA